MLCPADTTNSTAQSSPASNSTTLTATASSPKSGPASSRQPDVGPLVDLSDVPKVAPSSDQTAAEPLATPPDSAEQPQQNQPGSQSAKLPVEGTAPDTASAQNEYEHCHVLTLKGPVHKISKDLSAINVNILCPQNL